MFNCVVFDITQNNYNNFIIPNLVRIYEEKKGEKVFDFMTQFKTFCDYLESNKIDVLWCADLDYIGQILKEHFLRVKPNNYKIDFLISPKNRFYKININKTCVFGFNNYFKDFDGLTDFKSLSDNLNILHNFLKAFKIYIFSPSAPLTVGIISKMFLLEGMYHKGNYKVNLFTYQIKHKRDIGMRSLYYHAGLNILNERYQGNIIKNVYVYDINSFYPYQMLKAGDLYGWPKTLRNLNDYLKFKNDDSVGVYFLNELIMKVKKNFIPIFYWSGKNWSSFHFKYKLGAPFFLIMFDFEFETLKKFYNIKSFNVYKIEVYRKNKKAYESFINYFYEIKKTNKSELLRNFAKLILNTAYGKIGQNPRTFSTEFDEDIKDDKPIKLIKKKNIFIKKNKMSVLNAAYITALGRSDLCDRIIKICGPNIGKNFIYSDCDSIHTFKQFKELSPDIGKIKLVEFDTSGRYLDLKKYLLINKKDGTFTAVLSGFSPSRDDIIANNKTLDELINNFYYGNVIYNTIGQRVANGIKYVRIKKTL